MAGRDASRLGQTMALLWSSHSRTVGRTGLTVNDFVAAAIDLAAKDGVEALSMRAIAARLGVRSMATYSFAPSKADLTALMVDHTYRDLYSAAPPRVDDWRSGLRQVAETNRALHLAHPWLQQLQAARSPMGPHEVRKHELELAPLDGIGLSDFEMDQTLAQLLNYAVHAGRMEAQLLAERRDSGLDDGEWWLEAMPVLERVIDPNRFPLTTRVGLAATEARKGQFWSDDAFAFGLERLLDGIALLIEQRKRGQ